LRQTAELEDFAVLEKEIAFLWEKQRKPREIDLPVIDVGGREIGVQRERTNKRGRDAPKCVQRGLSKPARTIPDEVLALADRGRGHKVETSTLLAAGHAAQLAAHIERDPSIALRPGDFLTLAADGADQINSPSICIAIERQCLEGNRDLGLPTGIIDCGGCLPDTIPVHVVGHATQQQTVALHTVGIDVKDIARPSVIEGIEQDLCIVVVEDALPLHQLRALDTGRV